MDDATKLDAGNSFEFRRMISRK
jgi:hypothetical protein